MNLVRSHFHHQSRCAFVPESAEWLTKISVSPCSDELRRALDHIVAPRRLKELIGGLQENPKKLEAVCMRSYLHANGFYKITLWDSQGFKLRLHSRDGNSTLAANEHVHNHRWAFASHIFSGGYRMRVYTEADSGQSYYKYRYRRMNDNTFKVEYLGKAYLATETEIAFCAGSSYVMLPTMLHNLAFDGKATFFSLVLTAPAQRPDCLLYSKDAYKEHPVVCESLAPQLVHDHLNRFLSLL
jgi:hypothetical protein